MELCNSCGQYKNTGVLNTLISYDQSGNLIISYICNSCMKNKGNIEHLINDVDNKLNSIKLR